MKGENTMVSLSAAAAIPVARETVDLELAKVIKTGVFREEEGGGKLPQARPLHVELPASSLAPAPAVAAAANLTTGSLCCCMNGDLYNSMSRIVDQNSCLALCCINITCGAVSGACIGAVCPTMVAGQGAVWGLVIGTLFRCSAMLQ